MFKYVNHIAYVVQDRDAMVEYLEKTFGMKPQKVFVNANGKHKEAVYTIGKTQMQLCEPLDPTTRLWKHRETHGPGVYHVAWEIDNIRKVAQEFFAKGETRKNHGADGVFESFGGYLTCNMDPARSHGVEFQLTGPK